MQVGIYCIRNKINNKVYVGQTKDGIIHRFKVHKYRLNKGNHYNRHLQKSWDKYGEDSFEFSLLELCIAPLLDVWEVYWINKLRSLNSKYGYNKREGGLVGKFTQESKLKMSKQRRGKNNAMFGKKQSNETKAKISIALSGKEPWNKGTRKERVNKTNRRILTLDECKEIKTLLDKNMHPNDIAMEYNISTQPIAQIKSGKHWSCKEWG